MSGTILVALSESPQSERAFDVAVPLARATGLPLLLVWVWEGLRGLDRAVPRDQAVVIDAQERRERGAALAALRGRYCDPAGVAATIEVPQGEADDSILDVARQHEAAYIVMVTRARTGIQRWYLGSVAADVVEQAPMPAILYHPGDAPSGPRPLRRVLVRLSGTPAGQRALEEAARIAAAAQGEVILLTTRAEPNAPVDAACWQEVLLARYANLSIRMIEREGSLAEVAADLRGDVDLVVVGEPERARWLALFSEAEQDALVRKAGVPVMIVHAPAA